MEFFFKYIVPIHVMIYRLSGGRIGAQMNGHVLLLLTTIGRKSGKKRTIPLGYLREGDAYMVAANAAGADRHPGWYWNAVRGTQPVRIQIGRQKMVVDVREPKGEARDTLYQRFMEHNNDYIKYQQQTERTIPVLVLTPVN